MTRDLRAYLKRGPFRPFHRIILAPRLFGGNIFDMPVFLNIVGNSLIISFDPKDTETKSKIKSIPGVSLNKELLRYEVPIGNYDRLLSVIDDVKLSKGVIDRLIRETSLKKRIKELKELDYFEITDYTPKKSLYSHQKKTFELHRLLPGSASWSEVGSGKCTFGKTNIQVNGEFISAEDLWNGYASEIIQDGDKSEFWATTSEPLFVNSLHKSGILVKRRVKKLFRQLVKEKLNLVKLDDGSEIFITKAHKLYLTDDWSNDYEVGSRVGVPRYLPHESGDLDPELAELMGWMVGDGCERSSPNNHIFTQKDDIDRGRFLNLLTKVCDKYSICADIKEIAPRASHNSGDISITDIDFRELLEEHGYHWGELSANKQIPSSVMIASKESVKRFLISFFDAEGSVDTEKHTVEITSASRLLMLQLSNLLRRFGIWLRVRKRKSRATNGNNIYRDYWVGSLGGDSSRLFYEEIGFTVAVKQHLLKSFQHVKVNTNTEGLPTSPILQEIVKVTGLPIRHLTGDYTGYYYGKEETSRKTLSGIILPKIDKILNGEKLKEVQSSPRKKGRFKKYLPIYENLDLQWLRSKRDQLQKLIDQEVHYTYVKSIEEVDYEGWVYDLEVEEDHNYVAENILCHNTASAICAVHWRFLTKQIDRCLVVCPLSVISNWKEELIAFSNLTFTDLIGDKKVRAKKLELDRQIYLINYEGLRIMQDDLAARDFHMVVLDEAHRVKNSQSGQAKASYVLGDRAKYRIALTGTPVLNSTEDVFGIMRFVEPSIFGESFFAFRNRYFKNVSPQGAMFQIFVPKSGAEEEISEKMYSVAIRFLKSDCLDLPPAISLPDRIITLTPEQDKAYNDLQENLLIQLSEQEVIKVNHVLTMMLKLNQVTSGWFKIPDTQTLIEFTPNPKFEELKLFVEEIKGSPCILWGYYRYDIKLMYDYYTRCPKCQTFTNDHPTNSCPKCQTEIRYRVSLLQGGVKDRFAQIAKFRFSPQERAERRKIMTEAKEPPKRIRAELGDLLADGSEPPQTNVFVAQVTSGSEGLNLQRAKYSIYFSRNWSLKDRLQSKARNHRGGQKETVCYLDLVCCRQDGSDTIDQRVLTVLKKKESLSARINKDDIKFMLGEEAYSKRFREAFKKIDDIDDKDIPQGDTATTGIDPENAPAEPQEASETANGYFPDSDTEKAPEAAGELFS